MKKIYQKNQKKAFSLIELSIVIVVLSILITGALSVSTNSINITKTKVTKDRMAEVYKALGNYMLVNKSLPCPAPITNTKSGTTYGVAGTTVSGALCGTTGIATSTVAVAGVTNLVRGMLPVKTLGLPFEMAEDGFGDKFEYVVNKYHTIASTGTVITGTCTDGSATATSCGDFGTTTSANISINEKPSSSATEIESAAVFAIISLGGNKLGAYGADLATRNALPTDTEEASNVTSSTSSDASFLKVLYVSSGNSDAFDDVVFYKNRNSLVSDFKALSLIPCVAASSVQTLYDTTITWPLAWYGQISVDDNQCPSGYRAGVYAPTKKCGALGNWNSSPTNPCTS